MAFLIFAFILHIVPGHYKLMQVLINLFAMENLQLLEAVQYQPYHFCGLPLQD